jgi:hypothetical protein
MADDHGLGIEPVDDPDVTGGDVVDALAGERGGILPGGGHGGRVARPPGSDRVVARLPVQIGPVVPRVRVDPQAVDEDDRGGCRHGRAPFLTSKVD